jgi:ribosomal protein S18 acetylase RimI-like enzyme
MAVKIRPIVLKDAASYRRCYDAVAKERQYFCEHHAPPLSEVRAQMRKDLRKKSSILVAVDGARVVGFAAVYRLDLPTLSHSGRFGIGLLPAYREMGLGAKLMAGVLKMSRRKFDVLYLEVFGKNNRARTLYKKMGFELCGRIKNYVKGMANGSDDALLMQKLLRG